MTYCSCKNLLFCNWDEIWLKSCDFLSCTSSFVLALDIGKIAKIESLHHHRPETSLERAHLDPQGMTKNMVIWSFGMGKNNLEGLTMGKKYPSWKNTGCLSTSAKTRRPLSLNILRGLYSEMIQQRWGGVHDLVCCWKNWSDIQWVGISYNIYVFIYIYMYIYMYIYIYIILYYTLLYTVWCEFCRCGVKRWLWWGFTCKCWWYSWDVELVSKLSKHVSCTHIIIYNIIMICQCMATRAPYWCFETILLVGAGAQASPTWPETSSGRLACAYMKSWLTLQSSWGPLS